MWQRNEETNKKNKKNQIPKLEKRSYPEMAIKQMRQIEKERATKKSKQKKNVCLSFFWFLT